MSAFLFTVSVLSAVAIGWLLRAMVENSRYATTLLRQRRQIDRWKREDELMRRELDEARSRWHAALAEELVLYNETLEKREVH